ncbi:MAG: serine hydrolase [Lachnospirales bacterium]
MTHKNLLIYFNIFILTITISFSNIYSNFCFSQPVTEPQTETTTEEPSIVKNFCEESKELTLNSRAVILVDATTGETLYEKNADEVLYPASITKILTTLIACEEGNLTDKVTHSENAINGIGYGSSTMGMKIGETISFEDALYGIMMCSANETCMAVAEHISGSVDAFVQKMNEKAVELGCKNTHFANPHGFHDPNHYTTARDMSIITREAVKNEEFSKVWGTMIHTLPATNLVNEPRGLVNKAKILDDESPYYYADAIGAKTGFHDDALNTLVTCAERDGIKLIAVVMKAQGYVVTYGDTKTLFDYGFSQYENKTVYEGTDYTDEVPVVQNYKNKDYTIGNVKAKVNGSVDAKVLKSFDKSKIIATPILNERIETPIKSGDVIGTMKVMYNDNTIGELDIVADNDVNKASEKDMAIKWLFSLAKIYGKKALIGIGTLLAIFIIFIIIIRIFRKILRRNRRKQRLKYQNRDIIISSDVLNNRKRRNTQKTRNTVSSENNSSDRKRTSDKNSNLVKKKRPVDKNGNPVKKKRPVDKNGNPIKKKRPVDKNGNPVKRKRPVDKNGNPVKRKRPADR